MQFNSFVFFLFLIVVIVFYHFLFSKNKKIVLLVSSYIFYAFWDYRFCSLLLLSSIIDYTCGYKIDKSEKLKTRRTFLFVSIFSNLAILSFFKYFNFFAESFTNFTAIFGMQLNHYWIDIVLPVGISFYTFQSMSYTIDIYRRQMKASSSLLDFLNYVSFFPQLVAGPIERSRSLLPQLSSIKKVNADDIWNGSFLIIGGLFKKCIISDNLYFLVEKAFENPVSQSSISLWEGLVAFSLQIYFDFSAYSDIARGVAKLLGIDLMINFREPYFSKNIREFWKRWHISLSSWLRDYLYISLGGNRVGFIKQQVNIFIVMLLGGLWHGANYTFILWGLLHACYILVNRFWQQKVKLPISKIIAIPLTYFFVLMAWVPFRSESISDSMIFYRGLFIFDSGWRLDQTLYILFMLLLLFFMDLPAINNKFKIAVSNLHVGLRLVLLVSAFIVICLAILAVPKSVPFLYFKF